MIINSPNQFASDFQVNSMSFIKPVSWQGWMNPETACFLVTKSSPLSKRTLPLLWLFSHFSSLSWFVMNFLMWALILRQEYGVQDMEGKVFFNQGTAVGLLQFWLLSWFWVPQPSFGFLSGNFLKDFWVWVGFAFFLPKLCILMQYKHEFRQQIHYEINKTIPISVSCLEF